MIIIQMMGGLGNQLFQYALYCQLVSMGKTVKVDDVAGFKEDIQRRPELEAFGVEYERASAKEIIEMRDSSPLITAKIRRKLFGRNNNSYFEENKCFQSKIFDWDNIYLEGYWQSEKYFPDVGDKLKEEISIKRLKKSPRIEFRLSEQAERYLWRIEQTNSVSVHFRRGDYFLPENKKLFGNICTDYYYNTALTTAAKMYPGCIFYVFSDDLRKAERWIDRYAQVANKVIMVDVPLGRDREALVLMSRCRHNILANSSFSWWASYLNSYPKKTVMAPEKWLNGWDCEDIYRPDMIRIKSAE